MIFFSCCALLAAACFSVFPCLSLGADAPKPSSMPAAAALPSTIFNFADLAVKTTPNGSRRDVANQATATLEKFESHISTLKPGEMSHPPHRHPQEEFIILKEGTLDVAINGKVERVGPGSMFFFASNDLHNVRNVGGVPATYVVFNVTTAVTHTAPSQAAAESASPEKMKSSVWDWEKLPVKTTKTGQRRDFVDQPTVTTLNFECHATTLNPGESPHSPHHHPDEEWVIVKEGQLDVTINGVAKRAGPGSICFYASGDEHGMKNAGTTQATYHVVRIITANTPKTAAP